MASDKKEQWQKAIKEELNAMIENDVWDLTARPSESHDGKEPNITEPKWVFKNKQNLFNANSPLYLYSLE